MLVRLASHVCSCLPEAHTTANSVFATVAAAYLLLTLLQNCEKHTKVIPEMYVHPISSLTQYAAKVINSVVAMGAGHQLYVKKLFTH